jgi:transcriptional regulator with XRE-family HTH domain
MLQARIDQMALARAMLNKGWSPDALEAASGVTRSTITAALNGARAPHASTVERMARHLGVQAASLWIIEPGTVER